MDSNDWGYDPLKTIADQAEFIKKLAGIVGMDWHNANVWKRHAELEQRIATLAARTQPAPVTSVEVPRLSDEEIRDLWTWSASFEAERTATTQQHRKDSHE